MNNQIRIDDVYEIIDNVKIDVNKFTNNIAQSDDITMLVFKYKGSNQ